MQGPRNESDNIISIFRARKAETANPEVPVKSEEQEQAAGAEENLNNVVRRNLDNAERVRQERLKANRDVLKSYKIKN